MPRSAVGETQDGIKAAQLAYPAMLALSQKYDAKFAKNEVKTAATRGNAELTALSRVGGRWEQALKRSSPEIRNSAALMNRQLQQAGPSQIEKTLTRQAQEDLALGGSLNADELRQVTQGSREGWAARGLSASTGGAVAEVMGRAQASDQRRRERQGFASSVETANQQRKEADRGFSINALNTSVAHFDPQQRMFGHAGSAVTGVVQGPREFQQFGNMADSAAQGNQQEAIAAANRASAEAMARAGLQQDAYQFGIQREDNMTINANNNRAGMRSGLIAGIGSIAGSTIGGLIIF